MASATPTDPGFVGYKALINRAGSQPTSLACLSSETRSSTVINRETIGNCCPTVGACDFPTSCLLGTLFYSSKTRVCGVSSACNSFTVLATSASIDQPSTVDYFCYATQTTWPYPTLYLTDPALQASTTTTSNTASSSQPAASGDTSPKDSSSKAWIAGAVIGPLALLIAVVVASYLLVVKRRRKGKAAPLQPPDDTYLGQKAELDGGGWSGSVPQGGGTNHAHELDSEQHLSERKDHYLKEAPGMRQELNGAETPVELNGAGRLVELNGAGRPVELNAAGRPVELNGVQLPAELTGTPPPAELSGYHPQQNPL